MFHSVQGEGKLAGVPSVFVRASGCNLRCAWCDTPYASWRPEGEEMSVEEIVEAVAAYPCRHVVFTGGEPVIMPEAEGLCARWSDAGVHVTVETAATVFKPLRADLFSLSPKLSNSTPEGRFAEAHEKQRWRPGVAQQFVDLARERGGDVQLKFVISDERDVGEARAYLAELRGVVASDVLLMPEGTSIDALRERSRWLAEVCKAHGYRLCPRLHVELYGNTRGT